MEVIDIAMTPGFNRVALLGLCDRAKENEWKAEKCPAGYGDCPGVATRGYLGRAVI